jgi:hypothetical protein
MSFVGCKGRGVVDLVSERDSFGILSVKKGPTEQGWISPVITGVAVFFSAAAFEICAADVVSPALWSCGARPCHVVTVTQRP